jgi:enoyl-CoA hydratase/carnithine racemase
LGSLRRCHFQPWPPCVGGGLELVLACDLIWAAASARFGQLEATIGTTTLLGGVQRLAERAGASRAREIIYTADQYDAATFERWNCRSDQATE